MLLSLISSYLIGSIPTAFIFGKVCKGIDIRDHGSGNVGASNTFRVLGKTPGTLVLIIDILKGVIPITFIANLWGQDSVLAYVLIGIFVVAGHNWTIFLKFRGGKGIATTLGVLIGLTIQITSIRPVLFWTILAWLIVFLIFGYISLASILASIAMPILMVITYQPIEIIYLSIIFCIFVVFRHQANIKRLLAGNESRVNLPHLRKIKK